MTVAPSLEPVLPPRRRPWGILVLVAVVLAVVAYLAFCGIGSALVYYRTPTELAAVMRPIGETMRLGGHRQGQRSPTRPDDLTFILTDSDAEIEVHSTVAPTLPSERGREPWWRASSSPAGVFEATRVIVKHDENYQAPAPGHALGPRLRSRGRVSRLIPTIGHVAVLVGLASAYASGRLPARRAAATRDSRQRPARRHRLVRCGRPSAAWRWSSRC